MGMSSSQARLLTLTARLHSIELKAQKHEADKLRLANDSDRVYETYLNALEQTKLVANVMSNDGSMTYIDLTANAIYNYKTLQNQYALITKDDKALIPASVSENYKNTGSLSEFLQKYDLESTFTRTVHHEDPNPAYQDETKRYNDDHDAWERRCKEIDDDYERKLKEYNEKHPEWTQKEPIEDDQTQPWWTTTADDSLATKFVTAGSGCYRSATNGGFGCYAHVLAHIIDFSDGKGKGTGASPNSAWYNGTNNLITTTIGSTIAIESFDITGAGMNNESNNNTMAEVSVKIDDETLKPSVADGETCDVNASSSDYEKLTSKWDYRTGELKSVKQWAKDLYYVCKNTTTVSGFDRDDFKGTVTEFQEALKNSLTEFNEEVYNQHREQWEKEEPKEPIKPPYPPEPNRDDYVKSEPTIPRDEVLNHTTFNNKDKAQWYINLWAKMEGLNDTPKVMEEIVHDDATNTDKYIYSCDSREKSNTTYGTNADWNVEENENYMVIPDDKLDDPKWIRNAVVEGYVLIQEFDKENNRFFDTSVSVTTRIHEIADEVGVKKAEAQYEADMAKIDRKDRYYDTEIAKCENERSAIKNELDTLKTVAKENVDRTFKLFS